jgi:heme/copper-type cytochrome/quinol oxidase subunit 2
MSRQSAEVIFWLAAATCAAAQLAILAAVFSPRQSTQSATTIPQSRRGTEILWALIPAVGLAVLFAATWRAIH